MASVMAIFISYLALALAIFFSKSHGEASGFTIDLIHRDSLQIPVPTPSQRVKNAIQRSLRRVRARNHGSQQPPSVDLFPDDAEYLMKFSLGTPPVEILAIADTGSDLIWTQCRPCHECYHHQTPLFDSSRSSSYRPISCTSKECASLETPPLCDRRNVCRYGIRYNGGSISTGNLAKETITLGSTTKVMIPNVTIGCGYFDTGDFHGGSGIVGLGGGKASLISQMDSLIQGKFSYCLVPILGKNSKHSEMNSGGNAVVSGVDEGENLKNGKMNFGDNAVVSGDGVVTTPIISHDTFTNYFLTLEGITVGNQRLKFYDNLDALSNSNGSKAVTYEGNIMIDSGASLTYLPTSLYDRVVRALKSQVKAREIDDPARMLSFCFLSTGKGVRVPEIIAHFKGADVKLKSLNAFLQTSERSLCLTFAPTNDIPIYGNLVQGDFLVGYDLRKMTLSFKPTDCSTQE